MTKYSRTADNAIYLNEDRFVEPKESFKQIAEILDLKNARGTLADIGCATGEFLYYVRTLNAEIGLTGVDYSEALVEHGNVRGAAHGIKILCGDANALPLEDHSCDIVTTIGVTSIFDDFRPSFKEMIRVAKSGGRCLNHMAVNEDAMDVIIRYVKPDGSLESGWNRFSLDSIKKFLDENVDVESYDLIKHKMPFDLARQDDPMRSWTREINGERVLWNGLGSEVALYHIIFNIK